MKVKMAYHRVLLAVIAVHLVQCSPENHHEDVIPHVYQPTWMYRCVPDEGCQRTEHPHPTVTDNSNLYENVDLCRTVCGRFGGLWPKPVSADLSSQTIQFHPNFLRYDFTYAPDETRSLLVEMTNYVNSILTAECKGNVTEVVATPVTVHITVKTPITALTWNTDEEYLLQVQTKEEGVDVHIVAETVYGARHALETLTQLISADVPDYTDTTKCSLRIVTGATIRDRPVYKYRGFLLDSSRHFIPMVDVKRMIDGMAATKMNVFHWHVTDSHSFPLESSRVPQFTRYGAYSANEIYSTEEVRNLINYAIARGVRVVIEIDAPAHTGNGWQWGEEYGYGKLAVCVNAYPWRNLCIEPPCGQLNPANPAMYRVLRDLYRDIAELLPQPALFHMGGDEVYFGCWNSSQEIINYMTDRGFEINVDGFIRLWAEFHAKALQIWDEELTALGYLDKEPVMLWSSELTQVNNVQKYLNKDRYIIQVWEPLNSPLLMQLLRLGYRTISVPKDIWYLDHGFWGRTTYSNWRRMYSHTLPRDEGVLGGEVAMWTEYCDAQVLDTRVWPRTAAVAERLWSDPSTKIYEAEPRMQRLRSRLLARGIRPDAISPGWCEQHDSKCQ